MVCQVWQVDWRHPQAHPKGSAKALWEQEQGGRNVLLRMARGLTPKKTVAWPLPECDVKPLDWRIASAVPTRRLHCKTTLTLDHFSNFDIAEVDDDYVEESD